MSKKPIARLVDHYSYRSVFAGWVFALIIFACIYTALSYVPGHGPTNISGTSLDRFLASLYYSVITSTNTGYGDIVPIGFSRFFAGMQAFVGLFLVAVFISKLLTQKQDEVMTTLRELTLSNRLRGIREDLYLARVDFGTVAKHFKNASSLSEREWQLLGLAVKQCALQFEDMAELLGHQETLEGTLARKDTVIIEATHRTLSRLTHLLSTLEHNGIVWKDDHFLKKEAHHAQHAASILSARWKKYAHRDSRTMIKEIDAAIEHLA